MTKRPADDTKLQSERKPLMYLPDTTNIRKTSEVEIPITAAVPLNSYKPESKRVCVRVFKTSDTRTDAMIKAEKLQSSLNFEVPCLIKFMHPSICSGGFSLGLSNKFCENLPLEDCEVTLEDEELKLFRTKYLARKKALSGGWRGFSIAHKLVVGDVVVFQLTAPCKMKAHIVRVSNFANNPDITCPEIKELPNQLTMVVYNDHDEDSPDNGNVTDETINKNPDTSEDVIRFSNSNICFKDIKSFKDFHIVFDGLIIDSEFNKHMRFKYYELCKSQDMFLHDKLLKGINCKLVAGIILETISIADAVKTSCASILKENFIVWNKSLKAVEELGMRVQFLREMIESRVGFLRFDSEKFESKNGDELLVKLMEVQEIAGKFHAEIEALRNVK